MNEYSRNSTKRVKYIASIIYLLLFTFIVGGSYLNQQKTVEIENDTSLILLDQKQIE